MPHTERKQELPGWPEGKTRACQSPPAERGGSAGETGKVSADHRRPLPLSRVSLESMGLTWGSCPWRDQFTQRDEDDRTKAEGSKEAGWAAALPIVPPALGPQAQ